MSLVQNPMYKDILAAVRKVISEGVSVSVHNVTINPPKRNPNLLYIVIPRTLRSVWDGKLGYSFGHLGGSVLNPVATAQDITSHLIRDAELRARMLAEKKPGIQAGTFTHE